jgi:pimeloyl-ACP methyl ester carboxylesterase
VEKYLRKFRLEGSLKYIILTIAFFSSLICPDQGEDYPWLESLDPGEGYKQSGARLAGLDIGLNPLEGLNGKEKILLISVHGSQSEGYEWIYPLQTLDTENSATFFYRWNDSKCYLNSAKKLNSYLSKTMRNFPDLEKVILIGHSYGGVLVTSMVENWNNYLPAEIHSIAGPIGSEFDRGDCNYSPPKRISDKVVFYQWRTQHHLDSAFKRLKEDPQILNLKGSLVRRLPETYRGKRLGHNWSLSWVAEEMASN